jgi:hypothetical protein
MEIDSRRSPEVSQRMRRYLIYLPGFALLIVLRNAAATAYMPM